MPAGAQDRVYDPRKEERRRAARVPLPDDVTASQLDRDVLRELKVLTEERAEVVARHLVMIGRLIDDDPAAAWAHAGAARALAGRVAAVREAAGLAAYAAGEWTEALAELRAARRMTGDSAHLPVMADCERALGRPERALALGEDPAVERLDNAVRVELTIVLAGARRDRGELDAAIVTLLAPARRTTAAREWAARLWYALADAYLAAGEEEPAREWFAKAADADPDGATDAAERLLELDGVLFDDLDPDGDAEQDGEGAVRQDTPGTDALSTP